MNSTKTKHEYKGISLPFSLIRFMKYRKFGYILSLLLTGFCFFSIFTKGFNWGLDFTGGMVIDTHFSQAVQLDKIRSSLAENGITSALVQTSGSTSDIIIRLPTTESDAQLSNKIKQIMTALDANVEIRAIEFVGPNVGDELTQGAIYAMLATLILLLTYIGFRFEWRLGAGGIAGLAHDVIITLGVFSFLQIEMDLTFVAAILTVVGYSLNDSIVVFDRVRENFRKIRRIDSQEIIDISLTQTLARTMITSVTTLFVVIALLFFGGPSIHSFSLALLIGITFGTYSSIFVAIAIAFDLGLKREHMQLKIVEQEEFEEGF